MKVKFIISVLVLCIAYTTAINAQSCKRVNEVGNEIKLIYKDRIDETIKPKYKELISKLKNGGSKALYFNTKASGNVTSSTQTTFVSEVTKSNKVKIILNEFNEETEVCISVFNSEKLKNEEPKAFNSFDVDSKVKTFILNNVSNSYIIINLKGKSTLNSFKYEIMVEEINKNASVKSSGAYRGKSQKKK